LFEGEIHRWFLKYFYPNPPTDGIYTWPPTFMDAWNKEKSNPKYVGKTFDRRNHSRIAEMTEEEVICFAWSKHIHNSFLQTKSIINSTLSKLWVPQNKLRSGQNVPALHQLIRRYWYYQWSMNAAKTYVTQKNTERTKNELTSMSETEGEQLRKDRLKINMDKFSYESLNSYPEEWVAFLFLGKKLGTMTTFNCGQEVKSDGTVASSMNVTKPISQSITMPKEVRKYALSLQKYTEGSVQEMTAFSKKVKSNDVVVSHNHNHCWNDMAMLESRDSHQSSILTKMTTASGLTDMDDIEFKKKSVKDSWNNIAEQKASVTNTLERLTKYKASNEVIDALLDELLMWRRWNEKHV